MSLRDQIELDIQDSIKKGSHARRDTLRMVKSKILEAEVALRSKHGRDYRLNDSEAEQVISGYAKKLRQAAEAYQAGGRTDLADKEQGELEILKQYLPKQISEPEVRAIVTEAIEETGASSVQQQGLVMKTVMARLKGRADGRLVSGIVQQLLSQSE